jgi:hypothetical protein
MILASILGLCLWHAGWLPPAPRGSVPQAAAQSTATGSSDSSQNPGTSPSQAQTPPSQSPQPSPAPNSPSKSPAQAKPTPARPRRKKTIPPNCSNAPTALDTTVGNPPDPANSAGAESNSAGSTTTGSPTTGPDADAKNGNPAPLKPCPPPKKVVRNGGSSEPKVQLTGGTAAEQASDKSSTDQLRAATEENLKKVAELQLNSSQREIVSQIREFLKQSKAAVAAGDLEGAHNLAQKAHLLSDELVKP